MALIYNVMWFIRVCIGLIATYGLLYVDLPTNCDINTQEREIYYCQ